MKRSGYLFRDSYMLPLAGVVLSISIWNGAVYAQARSTLLGRPMVSVPRWNQTSSGGYVNLNYSSGMPSASRDGSSGGYSSPYSLRGKNTAIQARMAQRMKYGVDNKAVGTPSRRSLLNSDAFQPGIDGANMSLSHYSRFDGRNRLSDVSTSTFVGSYENWIQPEVVVRAPAVKLRRAQEQRETQSNSSRAKLPLDQLVTNYITSHRQNYLSRGWQYFKNGEYRRACDMFVLAESVSHDDLQERGMVKMAILQAAFASRQYMLAINSLRWLLTTDFYANRVPNYYFLNQIGDIRSRYGNMEDYNAHMDILKRLVQNNLKSAELTSLRSVILWSAGNKTDAIFYASKVAKEAENENEAPVWSRIYPMLIEASRSAPAESTQKSKTDSSVSSSLKSTGLPFETVGESK